MSEPTGDGRSSNNPRTVEIVEVGARDGLQSEAMVVDTATKVALIERAIASGVRRLEVASFVNPKKVPQMADGEAVVAALPDRPDVTYIGLVLNRRGLDRAVATGLRQVNGVVVCSDTFGQRNQGVTAEGSVDVFADIAAGAHEAGITASATVSVAFGCPYEGEVALDRVVAIAAGCAAAGADEIALADTIGVAVPTDVARVVAAVRDVVGAIPLRAHFHNTRNTGLANAVAAVDAGIEVLDASIGGLGGCPFAPNATGNVPTEDLVYLLERMGVATGIDLAELTTIPPWIETWLGAKVPGLLAKAGLFPAPVAAA